MFESIYIFDELTQGMHLKDIEVFKRAMTNMLDKGNTIVVVEHNLDFIVDADYIIDMGPDAGKNGGQILFSGYLQDLLNFDTYTSASIKEYLKK